MRIGSATDDAPGLRNRINATFFVLHGAERRAVVEIRAAIPVAVPRLGFERTLELYDVLAVSGGRLASCALTERREPVERVV